MKKNLYSKDVLRSKKVVKYLAEVEDNTEEKYLNNQKLQDTSGAKENIKV